MGVEVRNWAGNIDFGAESFARPSSIEELQQLVASSRRVRALGSGHSFNRIADTTGLLVSVSDLPRFLEIDERASTVTVAAGVRYGELASELQGRGFALHNLGSLPHISVAGACATGTHGSGDSNGSLATAVTEMAVVTASGELLDLGRDRDGAIFDGWVVHLGALGVVTRLTLAIVPTYDIRQYVYEGLPGAELREHFDEIFASAYSVSVFTDWRSDTFNQVWMKLRDSDVEPGAANWRGATQADTPRHPIPGIPGVNCTAQLGVVGPWNERLSHFRLEFTPSSGEELQSEYLLPRTSAAACLEAVAGVGHLLAPLLQICEIRTVAADQLWLSPCYRRDSVAFHFTWHKQPEAVALVLPELEAALAPFDPRPHWGKVFTLDPAEVAGRYERLPAFRQLARAQDPTGKFGNDFLAAYF